MATTSDSRLRGPELIYVLAFQTLGKCFHSILLQFTVAVVDNGVRTLIAASLGTFQDKPKLCSIEQVCQGVKCKVV